VNVHQVDARRVVDIKRRFHQFGQRVVELAPLLLVEIALAKFLAVHRAAAHNRRVSSDSLDISSEKMATVCFSLSATCCAMFSASAVFPIDGRPARMSSSPPCIPPDRSSNLAKPVLIPLMRLLGSRKALIPPS